MAPETAAGRRTVGRPPRFDPATERGLLLDAGLRVMRRNGYAEASVADILTEADVSSRAFYRHFESKDALLIALFRRDADVVAAELAAAVNSVDDPLAALDAWLERYLDLFYEPRRASRAAVMSSEAARRAVGYSDELARSERLLAEPLAVALRRGAAAGLITSADHDADARTVLAIANSVRVIASAPSRRDRAAARHHIERYAWPALGLDPAP
jgi:AcrR family transcriptional regulator